MMTMLSLSLAYAGFTGLCLAMRRHHRQIRGRDASRTARSGLRFVGWLCLASSLAPCLVVWDAAVGTVAWFGVLSAAGFGLAFSLPYAPRAAAAFAVCAPVAAISVLVGRL